MAEKNKLRFIVLVNVEGTLEVPVIAVDDEEAVSTVEIMSVEDMLKESTDVNLDTDPMDVWEEK